MKKLLLSVMCVAMLSTLIGCGTIKGFGEDIRGVGNWITKGSDSVQESLDKSK